MQVSPLISQGIQLLRTQADLALKELETKFEMLRRQGASVATTTILNAIKNSDTAKDILTIPSIHALSFLTKFGFISVPQAVETAIKLKNWEVHRKAVQAELEEKLLRTDLLRRQIANEGLRSEGLKKQLENYDLNRIDTAFALLQKPLEIRLQYEMQQARGFTARAQHAAGMETEQTETIKRLTKAHAFLGLLNILARDHYLRNRDKMTPTQAVMEVIRSLPTDKLEDYGIDLETIATFKAATGLGGEDTYGRILDIYNAIRSEPDPGKKLALQDFVSAHALSELIRQNITDLILTVRSTTLDDLDKLASEGGK